MSVPALAWRQFRFERRMFWRNPSAAFFNFALPLIFLFLIASVFGLNESDREILVPGIAGLWVAAGHGPWGISTGPASGRLLADLMDGRMPAPPAALDPGRFGTPRA